MKIAQIFLSRNCLTDRFMIAQLPMQWLMVAFNMMDADTYKPLEGLRGDGGVYQLEREGGEERVSGDTYGCIVTTLPYNFLPGHTVIPQYCAPLCTAHSCHQ